MYGNREQMMKELQTSIELLETIKSQLANVQTDEKGRLKSYQNGRRTSFNGLRSNCIDARCLLLNVMKGCEF